MNEATPTPSDPQPDPRTTVPTPAVSPGAASTAVPPPGAVAADPTPSAPVRVNPLAHLAIPFQTVEHAARGVDLEAVIAPAEVVACAEQLDKEGFALDTITGVDWIAQNEMEVIYDFFHPLKPLRVTLRTRVPRDKPELPTLSAVFPGANWHEREAHDFFAIRFQGHPNLTPFLLPEDATYHPLRKDFTA